MPEPSGTVPRTSTPASSKRFVSVSSSSTFPVIYVTRTADASRPFTFSFPCALDTGLISIWLDSILTDSIFPASTISINSLYEISTVVAPVTARVK